MQKQSRKPTVYGTPGAYVASMARKALAKVALSFCASMALGALSLKLLSTTLPLWIPASVAVLSVVAFSRVGPLNIRYKKAKVGLSSERRVAKILRRTNSEAVIHGALLGAGGDCDHLVVGPSLVAVETKTGKGKVTWNGSSLRAGRKAIPGNPVEQIRRQASAASGQAGGAACLAIVCVVDMRNAAFMVNDVIVCSASELPRMVHHATPVMHPGSGQEMASRLAS